MNHFEYFAIISRDLVFSLSSDNDLNHIMNFRSMIQIDANVIAMNSRNDQLVVSSANISIR